MLSLNKIGCGSAKKLSKLIYLLSPFAIFAAYKNTIINKKYKLWSSTLLCSS